MAKKPKKIDVRAPLEVGKRLGAFDHIIQKYKDQYDFIIVNDAKQSVERHLATGHWKIWDQESVHRAELDFRGENRDNRPKSDDAAIPCGIAGEGVPTKAYLLYGEKGTYEAYVEARNEENRRRQAGYAGEARQAGIGSVGGGVDTYIPEAGGPTGLKGLPDTTQ